MYVGMMSGTSLDGIDSVLVSFEAPSTVVLHHSMFEPYSPIFKKQIVRLLQKPEENSELARKIDSELGNLYADSVRKLIQGYAFDQIIAIGCHGQTIIHKPKANPPSTWQAGNGDILATRTGIPVVTDFRAADMQVGGQGAPLAPAFHRYAFGSSKESRAVVNIGGIANATFLPADAGQDVTGFDTGPGNSLSDQWISLHLAQPYDKDGAWALSSAVDERLLQRLMDDPYLRQSPPKSLDSRKFSLTWLQQKIDLMESRLSAGTVQSTIAAFTADSIWHGIQSWMPPVQKIFLCGGGSRNQAIRQRLARISQRPTLVTDELGVASQHVEACTMAWLAERRLKQKPGNIPSVTGARKEVLLGTTILPNGTP